MPLSGVRAVMVGSHQKSISYYHESFVMSGDVDNMFDILLKPSLLLACQPEQM